MKEKEKIEKILKGIKDSKKPMSNEEIEEHERKYMVIKEKKVEDHEEKVR